MRRIVVLGLLILNALLLVACGSNQETEALLNYINGDLVAIAEKEKVVTSEYGAVSGDNFTDDSTMYEAISNVIIPASNELIEVAEAIEIEDSGIRDVHEYYIESINTQHEAFTMILDAIDDQDAELMTSANDLLSEARALGQTFSDELSELCEAYSVELSE